MPYTELENLKLNRIAEEVANSINSRIEQLSSNTKLNYTLRKTEEEKRKYTADKILELQTKLGRYEGDLADFIQTAIQEDFYWYDGFYNDSRSNFIRNLVCPNIYEEDIEGIDIEEDSELFGFEDFISHSNRDYSHIYEFIEGLALASHYNCFLYFREEEKKEGNNAKDIYQKILPRNNKSQIFNGKKLNLSERIFIANEVLDFTNKINSLNISNTEKYQLQAYILGNDIANVRNRVNGTRQDKIREKEMTEYINHLMK